MSMSLCLFRANEAQQTQASNQQQVSMNTTSGEVTATAQAILNVSI